MGGRNELHKNGTFVKVITFFEMQRLKLFTHWFFQTLQFASFDSDLHEAAIEVKAKNILWCYRVFNSQKCGVIRFTVAGHVAAEKAQVTS